MKHLDLNIKIEQVYDPDYPYVLTVFPISHPEYVSWYKGKSIQEIIYRFSESFADKNLRYWHMMED